jgi:hypothetical protein
MYNQHAITGTYNQYSVPPKFCELGNGYSI